MMQNVGLRWKRKGYWLLKQGFVRELSWEQHEKGSDFQSRHEGAAGLWSGHLGVSSSALWPSLWVLGLLTGWVSGWGQQGYVRVSRNVTEVNLPLPVPPSQGSSGAGELQGGRTSQGTQLRSDIPSLGLRSCCSFRPNTNSAELLEVSQHARTHTASTVGLLCLFPLWHQRTLRSRCAMPKMLNKSFIIW